MPDSNSENINDLMSRAYTMAQGFEHEYVTLEHILLSCLDEDTVLELLKRLEIDADQLRDNLAQHLSENTDIKAVNGQKPRKTVTMERVFHRAYMQALFNGRHVMEGRDVLFSMLSEKNSWTHYFLTSNGITRDKLLKAATAQDEEETKERKTRKGENVLKQFCTNLNQEAEASRIDPLIGREEEVQQIVDTLARRKKNNVIMVGEPGVGKTAIVEGLAHKIVQGDVPNILKDVTVYSLDVGQLMAGTKYRGDMEERVKAILNILENRDDAILFVDEIHTLLNSTGSNGSLDIANLIKPALSKGNLHCIGSTTWEEYRKHFEKDRAFSRRFARLDVPEMTPEHTLELLHGCRTVYEAFHGVEISDEALKTAVDLSSKHILDRFLPDKAIDVVDSALAKAKIRGVTDQLGPDDIKREMAAIAKVPLAVLDDNSAKITVDIETAIRGKVFGQDTAIEKLLDSVYIARAGLKDPTKPMGSYLFVGPTGCGKTEVAVQLAKSLGVSLQRFDMSEYQEAHKVATLIGSPPGYVGYGDGQAGAGVLISTLEQHPNCVLLLDEVEKAHPDVLNILLQVMDAGRITSSTGKTVSARNIILIMTSNLGAAAAERPVIGFGGADNSDASERAVKSFFAPEFRNRLDATVIFNRLTPEIMRPIAEKFIAEVNELLEEKGHTIQLTEAGIQRLIDRGFDANMGARPLRRLITEEIKKPLAKKMLFSESLSATIIIDADDQGFIID